MLEKLKIKPKEYYVTIFEGPIGAGKSTLINIVKDYLESQGKRVLAILEPVDEWSEILTKFHQDRARYQFTLQAWIAYTRLKQLSSVKCENFDYILIERSLMSGEIFIKSSQLMKEEEEILRHMWNPLETEIVGQHTNTVLLLPEFEETIRRTMIRSRECETHISQEYLREVYNNYQNEAGKIYRNIKIEKNLISKDKESYTPENIKEFIENYVKY
jgi:deoxyadenosine/deoxycytidine kinase